MFFQNTTIDTILLLSIIAIIGLWMYHNNSLPNSLTIYTNNTNNTNNTMNHKPGIIVNDIAFPQEHNKARLLANQRGIVTGFHEKFKRILPELGWRSFYLRNFNGLNSLSQDNKSKTPVDNYMKCLGNTDNVYKYTDY